MKTKLLSLAVFAGFFAVSASAQTPVANFPFSSDFKNTVAGSKITAEPTDACTINATEKAAEFTGGSSNDDATSYVDLSTNIYSFSAVSYNIWVKPTTVDTWARIYDFGTFKAYGAKPNTFLCLLNGRFGNYGTTFSTSFAENGAESLSEAYDSLTIPETDMWYMLSTCQDKDSIWVYVNGVRGAAKPVVVNGTTPQDLEVESCWLGRSMWDGDAVFTGFMKDFTVYDKVLSASEVASLYKPDAIKPLTGASAVKAFTYNSRIYLKNVNTAASVSVFDITGRQVALKSASEISSTTFKQGVYVVSVTGKNVNYSTKLVVK